MEGGATAPRQNAEQALQVECGFFPDLESAESASARVLSGWIASALAVGLSGNSFAQSGQHAQHGAAPGQTGLHHDMHGHEMMQSMEVMHQNMSSMQMTGDHDHDFVMVMRSHHQAGIDMAKADLKNGKDPQMQAMAKKIISDQTKEIKKLDQWVAKHKASSK